MAKRISQRPSSLMVTILEDRVTPATFTVTTTNDNGSNAAPLAGSLRAAVINANTTAGADIIAFNIGAGGAQTLALPLGLPDLTETVTIDGRTQPGFSGTPLITIQGTATTAGSSGFSLVNHTGSTIQGLAIGKFGGGGVRLSGGGGHRIVGNHIGTNAAGTAALANGLGVWITNSSTGNFVGGSIDSERNVISGNITAGIRVELGSGQTTILRNFIGTTINGSVALPNGNNGIELLDGVTKNTIGGTVGGAGNVIAGNTQNGILITGVATAGNLIASNFIGVGFNGLGLANGQDGVRLENGAGSNPVGGPSLANANFITANTIGGNTGHGINVLDTSRFVRMETNSISGNGGLGISVAATANAGLPIPVITKVTESGSDLQVVGTVTGPASTQMRLEFYGNSAADPSGFGEGLTFQLAVTTVTDAAGQGSFSVTVPVSNFITATSQNTVTGETTGFSQAAAKPSPPPPILYASRFAVGAGAGLPPTVRVYEPTGQVAYSLTVFDPNFTGGVRVAMGDVNGDGAPDLIVGTGPGAPSLVAVFDAKTQAQLFSVNPFESTFLGGVYVGAGDLNKDAKSELLVSPDEGGGPRVQVYNGGDFVKTTDFFGIGDPDFRGGARSSAGDLNGDGFADLVVAAGFGGGPRIAAYDGKLLTFNGGPKLFGDFFAFEPELRNGSFVAVGDVNADGFADLTTGSGPGGAPRVQILDGKSLTQNNGQLTAIANFFAGNVNNRGGIRVASRLVTGDNLADVITGDGADGNGLVNVFAGSSLLGGSFVPAITVQPFANTAPGVYVG